MKVYVFELSYRIEEDKDISQLLSYKYNYIKHGDYITGIYAWTHNKKYANAFRTRSRKYKEIILRFNDDEYERFRKNYLTDELISDNLSVSLFKNNIIETSSISVVITKNEKYRLEDEIGMIPSLLSEIITYIDYYPLNNKYTAILDILGYCTAYDLLGSPELSEDKCEARMEYAGYQQSFGLSVGGRPYSMDIIDNEFNRFTNLYKELL